MKIHSCHLNAGVGRCVRVLEMRMKMRIRSRSFFSVTWPCLLRERGGLESRNKSLLCRTGVMPDSRVMLRSVEGQ